jgi:hypothetical protein
MPLPAGSGSGGSLCRRTTRYMGMTAKRCWKSGGYRWVKPSALVTLVRLWQLSGLGRATRRQSQASPALATDVVSRVMASKSAVRAAPAGHRRSGVVDWLWRNQESVSPGRIRDMAVRLGAVQDPESEFERAMVGVRADIEFGHKIGISTTPTFFVNGVRLPPLSVLELERVIRAEARQVVLARRRGVNQRTEETR